MTHKAPFPSLNVLRRNEPVATDTIYSPYGIPAIGSGATCAQFFCGLYTYFCDIYGMSKPKEFPYILLENIRKRGAMDKLVSDMGTNELSKIVNQILQFLHIL